MSGPDALLKEEAAELESEIAARIRAERPGLTASASVPLQHQHQPQVPLQKASASVPLQTASASASSAASPSASAFVGPPAKVDAASPRDPAGTLAATQIASAPPADPHIREMAPDTDSIVGFTGDQPTTVAPTATPATSATPCPSPTSPAPAAASSAGSDAAPACATLTAKEKFDQKMADRKRLTDASSPVLAPAPSPTYSDDYSEAVDATDPAGPAPVPNPSSTLAPASPGAPVQAPATSSGYPVAQAVPASGVVTQRGSPKPTLDRSGSWPEAEEARRPSGSWPEAEEASGNDGASSSAVSDSRVSGKRVSEAVSEHRGSEGPEGPRLRCASELSQGSPPGRLSGTSELGLRDLITQLERQLQDEERSRSTVDFELKRRSEEEKGLRDELLGVRERCAKAASGLAAARQRAADAEAQIADLTKAQTELAPKLQEQGEKLREYEEAMRVRQDFEWAREGPEKDALVGTKVELAQLHEHLDETRMRMQLNLRGMRKQAEDLRAENVRLRQRLDAQGLDLPPPIPATFSTPLAPQK